MANNKKAELAIKELLSRQNYLVIQGNDLAKAFGGLKAFEQQLLDYCFSFVTADSKVSDVYEVSAWEVIKHFGLATSGTNYKRIADAFKRLNENTALYLPTVREDGVKGILMTQLFSRIEFFEDGKTRFKFSEHSAPLVFDLKEHYYSFRLGELSQIKGKYALIMLKLWESSRHKKTKYTTISGKLDEWQSWFLEEHKRMDAGRFYANVLQRGGDELEKKLPVSITYTKLTRGRKTAGFEITFTDTSIQELDGEHED
ncbi:Initiator Replication protein [Enterococcus malodoratus]|uniref:replication initiation protein n=1 Tax=Enterococcus malodoratus TaxID=71451 RepID=UPI0008BA708B|nr:replication initiation protein [Enterococcus malodoratus]SEU02958.1 Initiator Replication protein [Enterococcus malodoratus]